jgi:excinuclease UvrABC ATPase subunit
MRYKEFQKLTPLGLAYLLWKEYATEEAIALFLSFLKEEKIDSRTRLDELPPQKLQILLLNKEIRYDARARPLARVTPVFAKSAIRKRPVRDLIIPLDQKICSTCEGSRLNPFARAVRIESFSIGDLCNPDRRSTKFISAIPTPSPFLQEPVSQFFKRLHFLQAIGLGYLSLDRSSPTLSGGEEQRIRLSRQLGS